MAIFIFDKTAHTKDLLNFLGRLLTLVFKIKALKHSKGVQK